jgi:succinate dehydrogenase (ubiquinone) cytochrome b560 subunit
MSLHRITPTTRLLARTFASAPLAARIAPAPAALALCRQQNARGAATTAKASTVKMTADENLEMLNKQRSVRPNSPHFTIYQPQLTWLGSIANRITGVGLSVGEF